MWFLRCVCGAIAYAELMKTLDAWVLRLIGCSCLIFLTLSGVGCATAKVDWDNRVGDYTMDQAILDFGPPDKEAKLTDGTTVVEWLTVRGYSRGSFSPVGGVRYYGSPWVVHYADTPTPDRYLRLVFSKEGVLRSWHKVLK